MKPYILLFLLSFSISLIAQQSEIKGIISIHNSEYETGKRQYVANSQVEDDFSKATPQTTYAMAISNSFLYAFLKRYPYN